MTSLTRPSSPEPTRRDVLAGAAGAAALAAVPLAVPLAGPLAGQPTPRFGPDDLIRVGLVGCGGRGSGAAAQALRTKGPVQLTGMADAFADRLESSHKNLSGNKNLAERIAAEPDHRFTGMDAFEKLMDSGIDMVILATPPHFRPMQLKAAIERGLHVFMEKPVAVDGWGVRTVLEAGEMAKAKGLAIGVGLQRLGLFRSRFIFFCLRRRSDRVKRWHRLWGG